MLERPGFLAGGFLLAAEDHDDAALWVELDDHVRALVDGPDVVVLVHPHDVRERPRVEILPDLANELAVGSELEKLRRSGGIRGPGRASAREDEDVLLRIHRDPGDLAEIQILGELQEIDIAVVRNDRHLRERGRPDEHEQAKQPSLHLLLRMIVVAQPGATASLSASLAARARV